MDALALTFTSGWGAGVNAYLVVLILGLAERFHPTASVPDVLASPGVLLFAFVLYAVEFVADKIPLIDSTWDAISTVIRPVIGAALGLLIAGEADSLNGALAATVGGTTALASHAVKAGLRLAINTSPEPVTNVAASVGEDTAVAGVAWFAVTHPVAAAGIAGLLLLAGALLLWLLLRLVRRGWRHFQTRRRRAAPA